MFQRVLLSPTSRRSPIENITPRNIEFRWNQRISFKITLGSLLKSSATYRIYSEPFKSATLRVTLFSATFSSRSRARFFCGNNQRIKLWKQICTKLIFVYSQCFYWAFYFSACFSRGLIFAHRALAFLKPKALGTRKLYTQRSFYLHVHWNLCVKSGSRNRFIKEIVSNSEYNIGVIFPASLLLGLFLSPAGWYVTWVRSQIRKLNHRIQQTACWNFLMTIIPLLLCRYRSQGMQETWAWQLSMNRDDLS